jgi:hypothetical protein
MISRILSTLIISGSSLFPSPLCLRVFVVPVVALCVLISLAKLTGYNEPVNPQPIRNSEEPNFSLDSRLLYCLLHVLCKALAFCTTCSKDFYLNNFSPALAVSIQIWTAKSDRISFYQNPLIYQKSLNPQRIL